MDALGSGRTRSLTTGIVRFTLTISVLMVLAAAAVTFVGTYRAATNNTRDRQVDYLQLATSEMDSRFSAAAAVAERAAFAASGAEVRDVGSRLLASQYVGASELIDSLLLADTSGRVVAAYPRWNGPAPAAAFAAAAALDAGESTFASEPTTRAVTPTVWVIERIRLDDRSERVLLARVRTGFMKDVVGRVSSGAARRAAVVAQNRSVVVTGSVGPELRASTASYEPPSGGRPGRVRVDSAAVGLLRGYWSPIDSLTGLTWRIIVAEPAAVTFTAATRATIPTVAILVFGSVIGVGMAWIVSLRLVAPLRELTGASLKAASGAYVAPLKSDRDDEVGRLAEAFNAVALRLNALHDVSLLLSGATRLDQVLEAIVEAADHLAGPGATAVYLSDDAGRLTLARATVGLDAPRGPLIVKRTGPFMAALKGNHVATVPVSELPGQWTLEASETHVLVAPLTAGAERIGVILITRHGRGAFSEAEVEMLTVFAPQAATAVTKSELFAKETESRRAAEVLRDVAAELVRPVGLSEALHAVQTRMLTGLDAAEVRFAFEDRRAVGLPESDDAEFEALALGAASNAVGPHLASAVIRRGAHPESDALLDRLDADALMLGHVAPATAHGAVLVVRRESDVFDDRDLRLLDGMARMLTIALDKAFSSERSLSRASNLETIFRISQAVGSSLQIKVVLNRVLDVVQMIFAADAVSLMIYDPEKRTVATSMARGSISAEILHLEVTPNEDLPGRVFAQRQPVMLTDTRESELPMAVAASELGLRSLLAVPLLARGASIGVLNVFGRDTSAFDDEDMGLLQTFASQAALAIDTAAMYGREHDVAATLQRSILPERPPVFEEIETGTFYEAAGSQAQIGGDYYDLFRAPDGSVVIAVADVCGKGIEAATKTSRIKYSVRALVAAGLGPAECLSMINNMVAAQGDTSDILTVWLGFLDAKSGLLRWANGGHPPGLLLRSETHDIEPLDTTGPLLGAIAGVGLEEFRTSIYGGDTILLYTDGVTEARSGNKFFGEGRAKRALRYGGDPDSVTRNLVGAVRRFTSAEPRDDMAIVVVRVRVTPETKVDAGGEADSARERE